MNIPRFTLRDMFLATTLIAIGVGTAVFALRTLIPSPAFFEGVMVLCGCGATIGAGVFTPFHRKRRGAII